MGLRLPGVGGGGRLVRRTRRSVAQLMAAMRAVGALHQVISRRLARARPLPAPTPVCGMAHALFFLECG